MSALKFQQRLPRHALALDVQLSDGSRRRAGAPRRILAYADLLGQTERYLRQRGAVLTRAHSAEEAVHLLAADPFDIVILDPRAPGGGLHLVTVLKLGYRTLDLPEALIQEVSSRVRLTPFIVLPEDGSTDYAVIIQPPQLSFLEDGADLRVEDAILRLNVARLLAGSGPSA